jgi:hypothetical protein
MPSGASRETRTTGVLPMVSRMDDLIFDIAPLLRKTSETCARTWPRQCCLQPMPSSGAVQATRGQANRAHPLGAVALNGYLRTCLEFLCWSSTPANLGHVRIRAMSPRASLRFNRIAGNAYRGS